jgi:hypothetical protein
LAGWVEAMADMGRPIPGQDFRLVGFVVAIDEPDLLGPSLFRRGAKFGSDGIGIDQLLGEAGFDKGDECDRD